jgi:sarcosine oxidase
VRVIVIGGGVMGLLTALECARHGAAVTVVDQAAVPNRAGTSHDWHRIVRALHPRDAEATRTGVEARASWRAIERRLARRVFVRTGALSVLSGATACDAAGLLAAAGADAEVLAADALAARYPHLRLPAGRPAVLEPGAGVVLADRALTGLAELLRALPAVRLRQFTRIVSCDPDTGRMRCEDGSVLRGDRIVLAAGPWSRTLLPKPLAAPLTLLRQSVLFYRVPPDVRRVWASTPAIPMAGDDGGSWLVPPVAGTPGKLSAACAARPVAELGATRTPPDRREQLARRLRRLAAGIGADAPAGTRDFYYLAVAAARGPLLARVGERSWALAACGGSAFKFAPLIARSLAARALDHPHLVHPAFAGANQ